MTVSALRQVLERDSRAPTIVLLQAGELNTGSFDPFSELIEVTHAHDAWVHVDGAFGLWAAASKKHRHFLKGVERAGSWATDGHKWLNVPYDSGYAFVADSAAHYRSFGHTANYLALSTGARDQIDWTPEYSRRARGFATYAAIASLGSSGIEGLVDRCCAHASDLVERASKLKGVEVLYRPQIHQGLLRFRDPRAEATEKDHDARTEAVTAKICESGEALFQCTTWRNKRAMRVSVCGWQTSSDDVSRAVAAIEAALV